MSLSICLSFDFDALSIWISTFKQPTPSGLSRGEFGARVGVPRILDLLERHRIRATFFVPAHTARTFPEEVRRIATYGHEIATHGDLHETPVGLDRPSEAAILDRAADDLELVCGRRPIGYRSPAWDLSPNTIELLEERGYLYDSSLMSDDYTPFRPRRGDGVAADGRVSFGPPANLWELPVAWELDDYPYFHFLSRPFNQGLRGVEDVQETWLEEFRSCREFAPHGVFTLTLHPEIIGRGPRIRMLDRLINELKKAPGSTFLTMRDAAARLNGE